MHRADCKRPRCITCQCLLPPSPVGMRGGMALRLTMRRNVLSGHPARNVCGGRYVKRRIQYAYVSRTVENRSWSTLFHMPGRIQAGLVSDIKRRKPHPRCLRRKNSASPRGRMKQGMTCVSAQSLIQFGPFSTSVRRHHMEALSPPIPAKRRLYIRASFITIYVV